MRNPLFIAEHRGGLLNREEHRQLIRWACACAARVLPLAGAPPDNRLTAALAVAEDWADGKAKTGAAMKASVAAHAAARDATTPVAAAVARAVGHAVATAHMADHSLGVVYALKAVSLAGGVVAEERAWQAAQLPEALREIVIFAQREKERALKLG